MGYFLISKKMIAVHSRKLSRFPGVLLTTKARPIHFLSFSESEKNAISQLSFIPEFTEAQTHLNNATFAKAVPLLERSSEICQTAMGDSNDMTLLSQKLCASAYTQLGHYEKATKLLTKRLNAIPSESLEIQQEIISTTSFHLRTASLSQLNQLTDLILKSPKKDDDCYVVAMNQQFLGKILQAEGGQLLSIIESFQEEIERITVHSSNRMQAMSKRNLGAMYYYYYVLLEKDMEVKPEDLNKIKQLWEQALDFLSMPIQSNSEEKSWIEQQQELTQSSNYTDFLCNLALVNLKLNDYEAASKNLSEALNIQENLIKDIAPKTMDSNLSIARILSLLGRVYHLTGQAVSSEGLFSSSIDKYEKKLKLDKSLHLNEQFDYALAMNSFSELLSDWENRDKDAANQLSKAASVREEMQKVLKENCCNHPILSLYQIEF